MVLLRHSQASRSGTGPGASWDPAHPQRAQRPALWPGTARGPWGHGWVSLPSASALSCLIYTQTQRPLRALAPRLCKCDRAPGAAPLADCIWGCPSLPGDCKLAHPLFPSPPVDAGKRPHSWGPAHCPPRKQLPLTQLLQPKVTGLEALGAQ